MKKGLRILFVLFCSQAQVSLAQMDQSNSAKPDPIFKVEMSLGGNYRFFEAGTFLGDTYRIMPGYRAKFGFGYDRYPGIGFFVGGQAANLNENAFLGDNFPDARFRDRGLFLYQRIRISDQFSFRGELGYGMTRVVHGSSPSRFRLNYSTFFANLGMQHTIYENSDFLKLNLFLDGGYGLLNGRDIIINQADRNYIRKSSEIQINLGFRMEVF
jgi:hypothetical protein